jgi:hypothetical protein
MHQNCTQESAGYGEDFPPATGRQRIHTANTNVPSNRAPIAARDRRVHLRTTNDERTRHERLKKVGGAHPQG